MKCKKCKEEQFSYKHFKGYSEATCRFCNYIYIFPPKEKNIKKNK